MGLIDRLRTAIAPQPQMSRMWDGSTFTFNGVTYPFGLNQTLTGTAEQIRGDYAGLADGAFKGNGIVFACMLARMSLFAEARFMYRHLRSGTPGELWSQPELDLLRHPWPGGTTGDLLARMMQDADLGGNSLWLRRPGRLIRLRPDWVTMIHGSHNDPEVQMWDPEAELLGYIYTPGSHTNPPRFYQPSEVAHYHPIPDPLAPIRGISWLTPIISEITGDSAMTTFKNAYLVNGATPNLVVTGVPGDSRAKYDEWVDGFEKGHKGVANAFKSLYLTPAMDAKVVGANLDKIDFKAVQGAGETRITTAAGVPASVVGISEGLGGSSLNAGNYQAAMRRFADLTMRPLWRNACGSLEQIIRVPGDSELWYDDRDIPALKDDIKDAAEVRAADAGAMRQLVDAGWEPDTIVDAIDAGDWKRLKHSGLYSVQLQPPGTTTPEPVPPALAPVPEPPKRDALLLQLLDTAERRAALAEARPDPVINVHTPDIHVTTPENPVTVTIERGAVEVSSPITIEPAVVNVTTPEVRNEISVEPTPVEITVEPSPVEVRNDITVEPTPLEITNEVSVEPTPVSITNEIPEQRAVRKTVVREGGLIVRIDEEPTDG